MKLYKLNQKAFYISYGRIMFILVYLLSIKFKNIFGLFQPLFDIKWLNNVKINEVGLPCSCKNVCRTYKIAIFMFYCSLKILTIDKKIKYRFGIVRKKYKLFQDSGKLTQSRNLVMSQFIFFSCLESIR